MPGEEDFSITVGATGYCQPIADLIHRLSKLAQQRVVAGRSAYQERGYAASIVLLLVVMLESYVGRVSFLQTQLGARGRPKPTQMPVPKYLAYLRKSFRLERSLTEVFVLRDAIAHGHVWRLYEANQGKRSPTLTRAVREPNYGNKAFEVSLNPRTRRSRVLSLNLMPAALSRREVAKVFSIVWRTLDYLTMRGLLERAALNATIRFGDKRVDFWELRHVFQPAPSS